MFLPPFPKSFLWAFTVTNQLEGGICQCRVHYTSVWADDVSGVKAKINIL